MQFEYQIGAKMFAGIDKEICEIAWQMVLPGIRNAADLQITNRLAGCIVVLDPRVYYTEETGSGEQPVIFTANVSGEYEETKYIHIAYHKAFVTFKHRLPSSVVQQQFPYLYEDGDTKWGGSTIDAGGLIVAFSGVQPAFDEMIAEWMASAIRALCRYGMTGPGGVMESESSFIGE